MTYERPCVQSGTINDVVICILEKIFILNLNFRKFYRELREELTAAMAKCDEATRARTEAETRLEDERTNASNARADLRATNQRLLLLQQAIADDISPDNGSDRFAL